MALVVEAQEFMEMELHLMQEQQILAVVAVEIILMALE